MPYFWDEAWVYAPAIKEMARNGISLLPNALSDSYSRGHPLLFFFTGAVWVKLFGSSFFSLHLFALVIAMTFVWALFYIIKKVFDPTLALIVASITLVQPIFIAQSAITLPEIFLSLWAVLTIYHFVMENRFYYFLFGTLMLLTKESGVVIIASLMLYRAICFFTQKISPQSFKLFIKDSFIAFTPLLSFMVFLMIQHHQRGYYFYPNHIALLNFNWHDFQEQLKHCYDIIFEGQGRKYITWSFLIAFAFLFKPIPLAVRLCIVFGLMVCVKIFFRYWALPDWLMIPFIGIFTSMFYYFMHIKYANSVEKSEKLLAIIFIINILYLIFSSINFFTNRYLLILVPLAVIYFSYYVKTSIQFRTYIPYVWVILITSGLICDSIIRCNTMGDDSPHYIDAIKLEQTMVRYLESENLQKDTIYCNFTMEISLKNKDAGFLLGNTAFVNTSNVLNKNTQYLIYTNIDMHPEWLNGSDTLPHFKIVKKFDYGIAHGKLFKRIL